MSIDNIVQVSMDQSCRFSYVIYPCPMKATIVIADGTVHTANSTENADLFWAIRGAGSNFGVCTELVVKLHEQRPTVYCGFLTYPASLVSTVAELTEAWWKKGPSSKEGMIQMLNKGTAPDYKVDSVYLAFRPVRLTIHIQDSLQVIPFYNGSEAEGRENFKAFLDLSAQCSLII